MSSLAMIMEGKDGLITSSTNGVAVPEAKDADIHLAPGALWRKIEIKISNIKVGEVLGHGSFSTVYRCQFQNRPSALKLFRNATEMKAFKEIEITFSMRHPNIIGIYAWLRKKGEMMTQIGMVIELAEGGDLMDFYMEKREGREYSFKVALKVALGAARGLAHMHSMPTPVVHRDIKSGNVMIMSDGSGVEVGKIADCGESRRVDLDSTMTQTGSPLWAAVGWMGEHEIALYLLHVSVATHAASFSCRMSVSPSCSRASATTRTWTRTRLVSCSLKSPQLDFRMPRKGRLTRRVGARVST